MIGSNYPVFYKVQNRRKSREQLMLISLVFGLLFLGIVILVVGYTELSKDTDNVNLKLVNRAYANTSSDSYDVKDFVEIVVPVVDIEPRTKITFNMLTKKKIPAEYAVNAIKSYSDIIGRYNKDTLYNQQSVSLDSISESVPSSNILDKIPAGYRAVTITLSPTKAIEGWLQAGTSVDVYWISDRNGKKIIVPIVQNARVISADRVVEEDKLKAEKEGKEMAPIPVTASLLVTSDDALKIGLASTNGEITLSLRGEAEKGYASYTDRGISTSDLLHRENTSTKKENYPVVRIADKKGKVQKYYFEGDKLVPAA